MYFHSFSYENWVIPEKIHTHTPTKEGMLENHTGGGGGNSSGNPAGRGVLNLKLHPQELPY